MSFKECLRKIVKPTDEEKKDKHKKEMGVLNRRLEKERVEDKLEKLKKKKRKRGGEREMPDFLKFV